MSTLSEIEAAIEALPELQVEELAAWLSARRSRLASSASNHAPLGTEKPGSIRDFFGRFESGHPRGADNEGIDADLAREAAAD